MGIKVENSICQWQTQLNLPKKMCVDAEISRQIRWKKIATKTIASYDLGAHFYGQCNNKKEQQLLKRKQQQNCWKEYSNCWSATCKCNKMATRERGGERQKEYTHKKSKLELPHTVSSSCSVTPFIIHMLWKSNCYLCVHFSKIW